MQLRCPYCHADLPERPKNGVCPSCGRVMILPADPATVEAHRARRRALDRIARDAERKRAEIVSVPEGRGVHGPRVLLLVVALLALLGGSLVGASRKAAARMRPEPHLQAIRELDTLATALGRFKFHVGRYPRAGEGGLEALVRDDLGGEGNLPDEEGTPRIPKWIGPYVNVIRDDPWGRPYVYEATDDAVVRLASVGPDGVPGTPDDLTPELAAFDPGTEWTNGWVYARDRMPGYWIGESGGVSASNAVDSVGEGGADAEDGE